MSASRAVSVRNWSTTTRKSSARKASSTACGLRVLGHRIAALDPGHAQRRIRVAEHVPAEPGGGDRDAHDAVGTRRADRRRAGPAPRRRRGSAGWRRPSRRPGWPMLPVIASSASMRAHGLAAVGVALHAEAGADRDRRGSRRAPRPGARSESTGNVGDLRGPLGRARRARMAANSSKPSTWSVDERLVDAVRRDQQRAPRPAPGRRRSRAAAGSAARRARRSRCGADRSPPARAPRSSACSTKAIWWMLVSAAFLPHSTISVRVGEVPRRVVLVVAQGQARGLEPGRPAEIAVGRGAAAEQPPEARSRRR